MAYSPEFQREAAAELNALPEPSRIEEMLRDYAVMRDQSRACSKH